MKSFPHSWFKRGMGMEFAGETIEIKRVDFKSIRFLSTHPYSHFPEKKCTGV